MTIMDQLIAILGQIRDKQNMGLGKWIKISMFNILLKARLRYEHDQIFQSFNEKQENKKNKTLYHSFIDIYILIIFNIAYNSRLL